MLFSDFNEKYQLFISDLNRNKELAVQENEKPLLDINREQLLSGENTEGGTIEPPLRNFNYAKRKKETGGKAPFWIPDLKLTGAFQRGMFLETNDTSFQISSTDEKAEKLTTKYKDIFGIAGKNEIRAQKINTKKLAELLKKATGL